MTAAWERALAQHRGAVAAFLRTLAEAEPASWSSPWTEGGWSPAQLAEHMVLYYEAVLRELAGSAPIPPRVGPSMRRLLRWFLLPHILFHRTLPLRARAPREIRPSEAGLDPSAAAERLRELSERSERALEAAQRSGRPLRHPYFGELTALTMLRFSAVHLEHHRRQIASAAG